MDPVVRTYHEVLLQLQQTVLLCLQNFLTRGILVPSPHTPGLVMKELLIHVL